MNSFFSRGSDYVQSVEIIYEDEDILLCRKPAGMATQTKRLGQQDMESWLKNYRVKKGEPPYIGIVHRLDQPVEGLMVYGKTQVATANLSKQVQQRMLGKYYYAVSAKSPEREEGVLENYLLTDKKLNHTKVVEPSASKEAKQAKLEYCVTDKRENAVVFDIKLHTGRQHQIRVQMAHMGCPLIGDSKYGNGEKMSLGLCSYRLQFSHPRTGEAMDYRIIPQGEAFNLDNKGQIGIS